MGCFLGCFGFSSKSTRRKPANRIQPRDQKFGRYEPLDSAPSSLEIKEQPTHLDLELSKGNKETLRHKIRKKVSFNLNVQTYEPIPKEDDEKEHEEETIKEIQSFPPDHRYRSYNASQDEEDETVYGASDLEDDFSSDYDDEEDADGTEDMRISLDLVEQFNSLEMDDESTVGSMGSIGLGRDARENCRDHHSVLRPVENLAQWKAIKAKGKPPLKHQRKENLAIEQQSQPGENYGDSASLMREVVVNASLSNWLVSPETGQWKAEPISCIADIESTCSWRNRDDMPVLDITNW